GIRDFHVTGVQTCALPIWSRWECSRPPRFAAAAGGFRAARRRNDAASRAIRGAVPPGEELAEEVHAPRVSANPPPEASEAARLRSEERRVGKECRARRARA